MIKKFSLALVLLAVIAMLAACSGKKGEEPGTASAAGREQTIPGDAGTGSAAGTADRAAPSETLSPGADWRDAFKFVRDAIRTEPSRYPLRTPDGVGWSRSANPLEKARFLARLLQEKGMTVEIAEGERAHSNPRELAHGVTDRLHHPTDLPLAPLAQFHAEHGPPA